METNMAEYVFDVAKRIQGRARDRQKIRDEQQAQSNQLIQEVQSLSQALNTYYGEKYPGGFDHTIENASVILKKKAGGSTLTIEVLGDKKYKVIGGGGAGGFSTERLKGKVQELLKDAMLDQVEDWFNIAN